MGRFAWEVLSRKVLAESASLGAMGLAVTTTEAMKREKIERNFISIIVVVIVVVFLLLGPLDGNVR